MKFCETLAEAIGELHWPEQESACSHGFSGAGFGSADHGKVGRNPKMARPPMAHLGQQGDEVVAGFAEVVGDLRRRGWLDLALDYAVLFELAQLRSEHLFADAGEQ